MPGWKYRLDDEGKTLRDLIDKKRTNDISAQIVEQIRICCGSLLYHMDDADKKALGGRIDEFMGLLDGEAETIKHHPEEIIQCGFDSIAEFVDDKLNQFYMLCADCRCWSGLP